MVVKSQANVNEPLTQECLKHYLKERGQREDILDYVDGYIGSISDCESAVKGKLAAIYGDLRTRLQSDRTNRPFAECVLKDIEEDDDVGYENLVLKETAIEMISNWRFWKYFSKSSRLDDIRAEAEDIVRKTLLKCKGHRVFGDFFSNIQDGSISWSRSGEQEYCIRKILVQKERVNPYIYNFRENPKNVRETSIDCPVVFKDVSDALYKEMREEKNVTDCYINAYIKSDYADYVLKAELLSKLTLSRSDKSKEKHDFIKNMVDISYDTKHC